MLEYGIDVDEFNQVTTDTMYDLLDEWKNKLKMVKFNMEKNKEFLEHSNHYLMLSDMIEKNAEIAKIEPPKAFFYSMEEEESVRKEKIADFAKTSSFPAFLRKVCTDILGNLVANFDKDKDKDKGFNNFIHTFFLNQKIFDHMYEHSPEFQSFADSINDVEVLDKFYAAREDKAFQEKLNETATTLELSKVVEDPLFCDVCTVMEGAGIFHKRQMKTTS